MLLLNYFSAVKIAVQNYTYFLNIQNFPRIFYYKPTISIIFVEIKCTLFFITINTLFL